MGRLLLGYFWGGRKELSEENLVFRLFPGEMLARLLGDGGKGRMKIVIRIVGLTDLTFERGEGQSKKPLRAYIDWNEGMHDRAL